MPERRLDIALIGYGKMGKEVARIARSRGHAIRIFTKSPAALDLSGADAAIEFTEAGSAAANIKTCLDAGVPVVCGTTGWNAQIAETEHYCRQKRGAMLVASNFSIGVNIFFKVNALLAKLMNGRTSYQAAIEETHHTEKKDAPSGTAISTANSIVQQAHYTSWKLQPAASLPTEIPVTAIRTAGAHGNHLVTYTSSIDTISLRHEAHSREGFAQGAVLAAEFLAGKQGIFTMDDILKSA